MADWEVKVVTQSNYIKTVKVDNCFNRLDAENEALSSTGAVRVISSNPTSDSNRYDYVDDSVSISSSNSRDIEYQEYLNNHYAREREYDKWMDKSEDKLSDLEDEIYELECMLAMERGEEIPSFSEVVNELREPWESVEEERKNWFQRIWNKIF